MVVGQPLYLLLLADLEILLLHLCLKLQNPILCPGQLFIPCLQLRKAGGLLDIICENPLGGVPVNPGLEAFFHPGVDASQIFSNTKGL